ncbi:MAG: ATP-binding protein, partial [Sphingomonadaceae bacterium]
AVEKSDSGAILAVSDRGRGMSAEFVRNRLFRPFASTKDGGFGIGAYEARSLINAMDGRLDVTSREGEGSRFTIILPAATGEMPAEGLQRIAS